MATLAPLPADAALLGEAPPSPAGPLAPEDRRAVALPPAIPLPRALQTLRFSVRQIEFVFRWRRELGETFRFRGMLDDEVITITSHPDHVKSLFTAKPDDAPSLTGESPLRPIVGPNSVLTAIGPRHMRQRKLLLPPFHGEAVARYAQMIAEAADREIDTWPLHEPIDLASRMQAITLDVIMAGIFGVEGLPAKGTPERSLRDTIRWAVGLSVRPEAQLFELININREEAAGPLKRLLAHLDKQIYAVIDHRREAGDAAERADILSLLLQATDEEGTPLTDRELRDELLTLVLAGHETTANSLAWAFERLVRTPAAYDRLRDVARSGDAAFADDDGWIEATIHETMRSRPVIPIIGRRVQKPWQFGEFVLPAGSSVLMSILLLHHREDVYPDPFAFRPERFLGVKPGTYTWIPFGGGIRRCLGATLAMAEQRVVLRAIARRTDLVAVDPAPEKARHRNVTMIPAHGARVAVTARRAG
ncbi:cytochrome P450 [Conexibacter stalactiti]|uniref:Cytochrome P450 n=1 Tax=Conexibacter stalactiti TaxID=1940611 RepID=A0ABU4HXI8_9ACTN|nr:cytochrome P450 [Conexibacter stalactiti]MDW5598047.1 cytochrome P450 [Conexibacter stalactiti]MEC5038689.1 cytochrome P450 [Conexibacter stalactiti]